MNRILYIEDNDINRFVFQKMVDGYAEVDLANDGYEGLDKLRGGCYDIVYLDLNLNDDNMDGFEVLRIMKEEKLKQNDMPKVIAMTAYVSQDWQNKCREAGFDGFIGKPINPDQVRESVKGQVSA